ncbi:hypothetical protein IJF85_01265 [Candidatus Saccharibacteria bacterium]|nr:hypothetical protein [Candidatus Saccharibacteria bacterium]MBQ7040936.1 hypothetical protein [Candidatus Saccharibacteria bacterium]
MNKDVIYIEPEDDITDIISKLRASRSKVVALVPPKKIGVLRSAVNTKLIYKAAKSAEKAVVIVTTDSALIKLSASAGIPVAKNLSSRPKMPSEIAEEDEPPAKVIEEKVPEEQPAKEKPADKKTTEIKSDEIEKKSNDRKKDKQKQKEDKKNLPFFKRNKKWIIIGSVGAVFLILLGIWAFAIAPSATISVQIRTTSNNFSEAVSFTTSAGAASVKDGKFYLETKEYKQENAVNFEATGKKDVGEKATGEVSIGVYVSEPSASVSVPEGTIFSNNGLSFTTTRGATVTWKEYDSNAETVGECENELEPSILTKTIKPDGYQGCLLTAKVGVTATESGDKYNVSSTESGWTTNFAGAHGAIYNKVSFTGGTSKLLTVVQQSDVISAQAALAAKITGDGKNRLMASISGDVMPLESTYKENTSDAVATPAVGEEVGSGVTPKLTSTTTYTILTLDKKDLKTYVDDKTKVTLAADQKIYETTDPFLERFMDDGNGGYTARLKATTKVGPTVTEAEILEKAKGKKIGELQSQLKSINGVSSCKVEPSFFWVTTIPNDANKITVNLEVEK